MRKNDTSAHPGNCFVAYQVILAKCPLSEVLFFGRFTDIYISWPGRVHDARVLQNSTLYFKGQQGKLFPDVQ